jgi:hypothetical protein
MCSGLHRQWEFGEAELTGGEAAVALLVFALVSTAGVLVPSPSPWSADAR